MTRLVRAVPARRSALRLPARAGRLLATTSAAPANQGYVAGKGIITVGQGRRPQAARRGRPARTLDGEQVSLADFRGKVVVVNVWGSWCPPCRAEAPMLVAAAARPAPARAWRSSASTPATRARPRPQAFVRRFDIPYPSHLRPATARTLLAFRGTLTPNSIPSTVVLDPRAGSPASVHRRDLSRTTLDDLVEDVAVRGWRVTPSTSAAGSATRRCPGRWCWRCRSRWSPGWCRSSRRAWCRCCPATCPTPPGCPAPTSSSARRGRMLLGSLLFVLGFSVVFVALGTLSGALGDWLFALHAGRSASCSAA